MNRRAFIGTLFGAVAVSGCSKLIDEATQPDLPDTLNPPGGDSRHPIAHLLNRAAYGPRPGEVEEVEKMGGNRWLDKQLDYRDIDDTAVELRLRRYDTLKMDPQDLRSFGRDKDYLANELAVATLVRAVYSKRQLYEVMVGFWSDHFSIYQFKEEIPFLKTVDDREVIRPYALSKFADLLRASAHSPAMLHYLDNTVNEKSHPNENYAREIMELHTLGVDGGYTEKDIQEVARCFTGWTMDGKGRFTFREDWHDTNKKVVLGQEIPSGGKKTDGEQVLDILAHHPSTAHFVCTKLVRRMVADDPPPEIVNACITTWLATDGDIRKVLRTLFTHPEFNNAPPKYKRPFELLVSILRATNANYDGNADLVERLARMGHRPFGWITPDGYPDEASIWLNGIFRYWELENDAVLNRLPGTDIDIWEIAEHVHVERDFDKMLRFFGRLFLKRDLNPMEEQVLKDFAYSRHNHNLDLKKEDDRRDMLHTLGILLNSPAFQWR